MDYDDLSIRVQDDGDVLATSDTVGESHGTLNLDKNKILPILQSIEENKTDEELLKRLGRILFDALFDKNTSNHFAAVKAGAEKDGHGVRVRLIFEKAEIAAIPWEFLYDGSIETFLANDPNTTLSRYIDVPLKRQDIRPASLPLKMLLVISNPKNLDPLDSAGEEKLIKQALEKHISSGLIKIDIITKATIEAIYQKLNAEQYNVLHFIGHGFFKNDKGYIALVDDNDRAKLLDDEDFANLFLGKRGLGLVILNACEGAATSSGKVFRGMASRLVQRGIPAVIAMQYSILDSTAKIFAGEFYYSLARTDPVDKAIQSARNLISIKAKLDNRDFATPVLFMRAKDGVIIRLLDEIKADTPPENKSGPKPLPEHSRGFVEGITRNKQLQAAILFTAIALVIISLFYQIFYNNSEGEYVQITGLVLNYDGNPASNADVRVLPSGKSIRTNSNGYFILPGISIDEASRLEIRNDETKEIIELPISNAENKNGSIDIGKIHFQPKQITLSGNIQDYTGVPSKAFVEIRIKSRDRYIINITDVIESYEVNVPINTTSIYLYDENGKLIYFSPLQFSEDDKEEGEKDFPIYIPPLEEININGKVYNWADSSPIVNATVKISNVSGRTNKSGYYSLFEVPRIAQSYQVSKEEHIIKTENLSNRNMNLTEPNWIYYREAPLWIPVVADDIR